VKTRSTLFAFALLSCGIASAQTFNPARTYVVGAKDEYVLKVNASTSAGDLTLNINSSQTVKKVYDNGDADIESSISKLTVNFGGNEITPPNTQAPTSTKFDKYGMPLTAATGRTMAFTRYGTYFGDKELKVGESYSYDQPDKEHPKNHTKGTVKLLSLDGGKAKLSLTVDAYSESADKPMHLDGNVTLDASNGKLLHFDGKAKDIPGMGQGPAISSADFTMDHK
jgi:hypothetical protein